MKKVLASLLAAVLVAPGFVLAQQGSSDAVQIAATDRAEPPVTPTGAPAAIPGAVVIGAGIAAIALIALAANDDDDTISTTTTTTTSQ